MKHLETEQHPDGVPGKLVFPEDGTYRGTWTGYTVLFHVDGRNEAATTQIGVRGVTPCIVTIRAGVIRVKAVEIAGEPSSGQS